MAFKERRINRAPHSVIEPMLNCPTSPLVPAVAQTRCANLWKFETEHVPRVCTTRFPCLRLQIQEPCSHGFPYADVVCVETWRGNSKLQRPGKCPNTFWIKRLANAGGVRWGVFEDAKNPKTTMCGCKCAQCEESANVGVATTHQRPIRELWL